ncbi:MAG: aspartyl protease family protein [Saprospiraceae bacterium]
MRRFPLLLLVLILGGLSNNLNAQRYKKLSTEPRHFLDSVRVNREVNLIIVPVVVNGKSYRFLLDTGAPTVISPRVAKEIGFRGKGTTSVGSSTGQRQSTQWGYIPEMALSGVKFRKVTAFVADLGVGFLMQCLAFDGIVGANLLQVGAWDFDLQHELIRFSSTMDPLALPQMDTLNFKQSKQRSPYFPIQIWQDRTRYFLFDTGFSKYLDISLPTCRDLELLGSDLQLSAGLGLTSEGLYGSADTTLYMVYLPGLTIGRDSLFNVIADVAADERNKLGVQYLDDHRMIMDFPAQRAFIRRISDSDHEQVWRTFGFEIIMKGESVYVASIWDSGPAQRAGIKKGDRLLRVVGMDEFPKAPDCSFFFGLVKHLRDSEQVQIEIEQKGWIRLEKINLLPK